MLIQGLLRAAHTFKERQLEVKQQKARMGLAYVFNKCRNK